MGVLHNNICCEKLANDNLNDQINTITIFKQDSSQLPQPKKSSENENKYNTNENTNNNQISIETNILEKNKEKLKKITNQTVVVSKRVNSLDNNNLQVNENNKNDITLTRINSKGLIRKTISISLNNSSNNNNIKNNENNKNETIDENYENDIALYKRRKMRSKSSVQSKVKTNLSNFKMKYEELCSRLPAKKTNATVLFTADKNIINLINSPPKDNHLKNNFNTISRGKTTQNSRKDIEIIDIPLTEKQVKTLRNILFKEELIIPEMNESTINLIINSIIYIRVKANIKIFSCDKENEKEINDNNIYYMIDKGILGYSIDSVNYELPKHSGIGTSALIKNCRNNCFLYTIKRCYLFKLPIEKYKKNC